MEMEAGGQTGRVAVRRLKRKKWRAGERDPPSLGERSACLAPAVANLAAKTPLVREYRVLNLGGGIVREYRVVFWVRRSSVRRNMLGMDRGGGVGLSLYCI